LLTELSVAAKLLQLEMGWDTTLKGTATAYGDSRLDEAFRSMTFVQTVLRESVAIAEKLFLCYRDQFCLGKWPLFNLKMIRKL
jgi:hypothetical protein